MKHLLVLGSVLLLFLFFAVPVCADEPPEKEATMITGLDGGRYEAYSPVTVKAVQEALKAEGLYEGEITGKLDEETMKALGEYQKTNGLMVTGVPTPRTRALLLKPPVT